MIDALKQRLHAKSATLLMGLETRLDRIMYYWLGFAALASAIRIATSPIHAVPDFATFAPYLLLILAPAVSLVLALRWFADGDTMPQPTLRLARVGNWRDATAGEAQ